MRSRPFPNCLRFWLLQVVLSPWMPWDPQTQIATTVIEAGADYVLSVKENQGHLYEDISVLFAVDQAQNFKYAAFELAKTTHKGHGRIDRRECWCTSNPEYLNLIRNSQNWAGLG
jgi:predicted transposase YbfD/YdcC